MIREIEEYIKLLNFEGNIEKINPLKSYVNEIYLIKMSNGKDLIFKIIKNDKSFDKIVLLNKLLQNRSIPIPKVLHKKKKAPEFNHSIIIENRVGGVKIGPSQYNDRILRSLAFNLSLLHSISYKFFTNFYGKKYSNISDFVFEMYNGYFNQIKEREIFNKATFAKLKEKIETLSKLLKNDSTPVIVHNDIYPDNILIENDRITGILDWENSLALDYRMDFVKIFWWVFNSNREKFNRFINFYAKFRKVDKNFKEIFSLFELITLIGYLNFAKETDQTELYSFVKRKLEKLIHK